MPRYTTKGDTYKSVCRSMKIDPDKKLLEISHTEDEIIFIRPRTNDVVTHSQIKKLCSDLSNKKGAKLRYVYTDLETGRKLSQQRADAKRGKRHEQLMLTPGLDRLEWLKNSTLPGKTVQEKINYLIDKEMTSCQ